MNTTPFSQRLLGAAVALLLTAQPITLRAEASPADPPAVIAKLTRILKYGDVHGMAQPNKTDAVIALGLLGDDRVVPTLAEHLENEPNQHLRLQITRALGWIGSPQCIPPLERALQDTYPFVRKQAAEALKKLTGREYEYDRTGLPKLPPVMDPVRSPAPTPG